MRASVFGAAIFAIALVAASATAKRVTRAVAPNTRPQRQAETPAPLKTAAPRFFFAGNGRLRLGHAHFNNTLDVRYRHADGTYDPEGLAQIRHFFRSREDGREAPIPLRLIELLSYIQARYHPREMTLVSGFRSPQFNADLRAAGGAVAQASLHTEGMAADVAFSGLDMFHLWRQLRALRTGGAGYYRKGMFLHLDTGPPRFWEETTSRAGENLSAGNARVFLRTDFDRYPRLEGAVCSLHSVTAFPLLIAARATLVGSNGTSQISIEPTNGNSARQGDCFALTSAAETYQFRIVSAAPVADRPATIGSEARSHVVLSTCEPRVEKTAAEIESNPIEVTPNPSMMEN